MARPRVGFLGVGWIGRSRMEAILATASVDVIALMEPNEEMRTGALSLAPDVRLCDTYEEMLALGLDGVVIATPSALHAGQCLQAIASGSAVFCQKPLGRDASEAAAVVDAARSANRLLAVDLSYRHTAAMAAIVPLVRDGALGRIQLVDLVFHNAYGPDKPWFYDKAQSGGGCVMDLGVHLVDLALWALGWPEISHVEADLFANGRSLADAADVEDLAAVTLRLASGVVVRLACSWRLHAGRDAVIEASFYGTQGGATLRNEGGSFLAFRADHLQGTHSTCLAIPPDDWGGRSAAAWARQLALDPGFDPEAERLVTVSTALDRIYQSAG